MLKKTSDFQDYVSGLNVFGNVTVLNISSLNISWSTPTNGGIVSKITLYFDDADANDFITTNSYQLLFDIDYFDSNKNSAQFIKGHASKTLTPVDILSSLNKIGSTENGMITFSLNTAKTKSSTNEVYITADVISSDQMSNLTKDNTNNVTITFKKLPTTGYPALLLNYAQTGIDSPIADSYTQIDISSITWNWTTPKSGSGTNMTLPVGNMTIVPTDDTTSIPTITTGMAVWIYGLDTTWTITGVSKNSNLPTTFAIARTNSIVNYTSIQDETDSSGKPYLEITFDNSGPYFYSDFFPHGKSTSGSFELAPPSGSTGDYYMIIGPQVTYTQSPPPGPDNKPWRPLTPAKPNKPQHGLTETERYILYGVIALVLFLIIGGIIWYMIAGNSHDKKNSSNTKKKTPSDDIELEDYPVSRDI
jgi:hypothetical protein